MITACGHQIIFFSEGLTQRRILKITSSFFFFFVLNYISTRRKKNYLFYIIAVLSYMYIRIYLIFKKISRTTCVHYIIKLQTHNNIYIHYFFRKRVSRDYENFKYSRRSIQNTCRLASLSTRK